MKRLIFFLGTILGVGILGWNVPILFAQKLPIPPIDEFSAISLSSALLPSKIPVRDKRAIGPVLYAKSALAIDIDTGMVLYEKNAFDRLSIASLTKIASVIVVLEQSEKLDTLITIPSTVTGIEPSKMYLRPGDVLTLRDLLRGSLIHSANDAMTVVAEHFPHFIEMMNILTVTLKLEDTHFSNPVGWDEKENYSSANDLCLLMLYALKYPLMYESIATRNTTIISQKGIAYPVSNTNQMFGSFLDVLGGKTGTTDAAGPSLINIFRAPNNHRVMTIVLNSKDRYVETKILSYWILKNIVWK